MQDWQEEEEDDLAGTFTIDGTMKALKKVLGGAKWIDTCVKCKEDG
jgi:hypothetical protein